MDRTGRASLTKSGTRSGPERSEDAAAARHLYEGIGFTNRERYADGPITYVYERDLGSSGTSASLFRARPA